MTTTIPCPRCDGRGREHIWLGADQGLSTIPCPGVDADPPGCDGAGVVPDENGQERAMSLQGYTTTCPDQRRDFVDIQEALHYHALANGDACWRDLLSHAAIEISRLQAENDRLRQGLDSGR